MFGCGIALWSAQPVPLRTANRVSTGCGDADSAGWTPLQFKHAFVKFFRGQCVASEGSHNTVGVTDPDPIIGPGHTFETVTDKISAIVLTRPVTPGWVFGLLISFGALMLLNMVIHN